MTTFEDRWFNTDLKVEYVADGSFLNAGAPPYRNDLSGDPMVVLGSGKLAQRIHDNGGDCSYHDQLLFVDCNIAESLLIEGRGHSADNPSFRSYSSIELIQPPHGPIAVTAALTIDEIIRLADASGIVYADARQAWATLQHWNRPDPFFGCQLFYPDSPGANQ